VKYIGKPLIVILEPATAFLQAGDVVDQDFEEYLKEFHSDVIVENGVDPFSEEPADFYEELPTEDVQIETELEHKSERILDDLKENQNKLLLELQTITESLQDLTGTVENLSGRINVLEKVQDQTREKKSFSLWKTLTNRFFFIEGNRFYLEGNQDGFLAGSPFRFSKDRVSWRYGLCSRVERSNRQTYIEFFGSPFSQDVNYLELGDSSLLTTYVDFVKRDQPFVYVWRGVKSRLIEVYFYSNIVPTPEVCGAELTISGKPVSVDSPTVNLGKKETTSGVNINDHNLVSFGDEISISFVGDIWDFQEVKIGLSFMRETDE
jgi:hypothetical protein